MLSKKNSTSWEPLKNSLFFIDSNEGGFTLIEILVSIVILAIILIPLTTFLMDGLSTIEVADNKTKSIYKAKNSISGKIINPEKTTTSTISGITFSNSTSTLTTGSITVYKEKAVESFSTKTGQNQLEINYYIYKPD